ncbi:flagellar basal body-associated protein FliL [Acidovorax sp. Leaf78]|uniref:flagellar basal body-associated FliL family protein n=1 Tax=unclassified Acidovorax TaxID=2684926 RepID=UPI0006FFDE71|nr:flagellar basal body-associated FliL family protein [Acidovorax sp. Leaf78]KQO15663.1 flagellar basal body protein FliL [Acidovorax sp. Leaf78]RZJ61567.1 MAG: flagellar basal body protein FliL [Acidovorax sp.]
MSANTPAAAPPAKSKKMLIIIIAAVAVLVIGGGAAAWFISSRSHADAEDGGEKVAHKEKETPKVAPTFLPLENMVVNLADPGGDRFAQIGITLEVEDAKTAEQVKQYLPSIRSGILMLVSQRTSAELLQREGKEKLATDVLREVSRPLGYSVPSERERERERAREKESADDEDDRPARRRAEPRNPVRRVLFSNFIIQ